jgi:hypothetical protein
MKEHRLYLNLGDNNQLVARCTCGGWQQERRLRMCERPADAERELEDEFKVHISQESPVFVHLTALD